MTKASPMPDSSSLVLTDGEEDNESNNNPQLAISFVRNWDDHDDTFTLASGFLRSLHLKDVVSLDVPGNYNIAEWMKQHLVEMTRLEDIRIVAENRALTPTYTR